MFFCLFKKKFLWVLFFCLLAAAPATYTLFIENSFFRTPVTSHKGSNIRLVHWNVFRGRLGWNNIVSHLQEQNADFYVVVESKRELHDFTKENPFWQKYQSYRAGNISLFALDGSIENGKWLERNIDMNLFTFLWRRNGQDVKFFIVHLASHPLKAREPLLEHLIRLARKHAPDIIVGDFNAPRRSRALTSLPAGYIHAYEAVGQGWSYSWPSPVPMYSIDQCIVGERILPARYELTGTLSSDHRMQTFEFRVHEREGHSLTFLGSRRAENGD